MAGLGMRLSRSGATFLRLQEGFVDHFYFDSVKVGTIGIGFTFRSLAFTQWWRKNKPGVVFGPGARMTRAEAEDALIFINRSEYGRAVNVGMADTTLSPFPQHVFDGVLSAVYNLGPASVKYEWAQLIRQANLDDGVHALQAYNKANGKKLAGLVRRRKEEGILILKGIYTGVDVAEQRQPAESLPVKDAMDDGMLQRGEAGPAVAKLIADLAKLGYYKGSMDDLFGYGTESAVLNFQRDHKLKDDGVAGPSTLEAIAKDCDSIH